MKAELRRLRRVGFKKIQKNEGLCSLPDVAWTDEPGYPAMRIAARSEHYRARFPNGGNRIRAHIYRLLPQIDVSPSPVPGPADSRCEYPPRTGCRSIAYRAR
jgi:hypothetical protein